MSQGPAAAGPTGKPAANAARSASRVDLARPAAKAREIEAWLVRRIAEVLQVDPADIDPREPFASYGLGSAEAVIVAGDLEEWLGEPVEATLAWDYPTVASLARHLGGVATPADAVTPAPEASDRDRLERLLSGVERIPEQEARAVVEARRTDREAPR